MNGPKWYRTPDAVCYGPGDNDDSWLGDDTPELMGPGPRSRTVSAAMTVAWQERFDKAHDAGARPAYAATYADTGDPKWMTVACDAGAWAPGEDDDDPDACTWCSGTGVYEDEVQSRQCPWCFGDGESRDE